MIKQILEFFRRKTVRRSLLSASLINSYRYPNTYRIQFSRYPRFINRLKLFWTKPVYSLDLNMEQLPWEPENPHSSVFLRSKLMMLTDKSNNHILVDTAGTQITDFKFILARHDINKWIFDNIVDLLVVNVYTYQQVSFRTQFKIHSQFCHRVRLDFYSPTDAVIFKFLISEFRNSNA